MNSLEEDKKKALKFIKSLNVNKSDLARKINKKSSNIIMILNGKRYFSTEMLNTIFNALGYSIRLRIEKNPDKERPKD